MTKQGKSMMVANINEDGSVVVSSTDALMQQRLSEVDAKIKEIEQDLADVWEELPAQEQSAVFDNLNRAWHNIQELRTKFVDAQAQITVEASYRQSMESMFEEMARLLQTTLDIEFGPYGVPKSETLLKFLIDPDAFQEMDVTEIDVQELCKLESFFYISRANLVSTIDDIMEIQAEIKEAEEWDDDDNDDD